MREREKGGEKVYSIGIQAASLSDLKRQVRTRHFNLLFSGLPSSTDRALSHASIL